MTALNLFRHARPTRRAVLLAVTLFVAVAALGGSAPASAQAPGIQRLQEPPAGQAYFELWVRLWDTSDPAWGDTRPFAERMREAIATELGGKTPTFFHVWATWQYPDRPGQPLVPFSAWGTDIDKAQSVVGASSVLYLDWTLTLTTRTNGGITVSDVASGRLDDYIAQYARSIRTYARPVLIRLFGGEFNGNWWWGQSPRANPALSTADFAAAWRRVVDIFRENGALNASWAWIPIMFPPVPVSWVDPDLAAYYPGDAYVDWAGADLYDLGPVSWLDGTYAFAAAHGKPFFLAEFGIRHSGSTLSANQQNAWLYDVFDWVETHPAVKAISYFDQNVRPSSGVPLDPAKLVCRNSGQVCYQANVNDNDHRLLADSGAGFAATFSSRVSSTRYRSSPLIEPATGATAAATMSRPAAVENGVALIR